MWSTYLQQLEGITGFTAGSDGEESVCSVGDLSSIPELGRSPGEGHGNSLQYSCLENSNGQKNLGYSRRGRKELDMNEVTKHKKNAKLILVVPI